MGDAGFQRQTQGFGVHMRDHEDILAALLHGHNRDKAVRVEARREGRAFFEVFVAQGFWIGESSGHDAHLWLRV
ncbi:hypothetical protein D9M69_713110 [compost metagenome]